MCSDISDIIKFPAIRSYIFLVFPRISRIEYCQCRMTSFWLYCCWNSILMKSHFKLEYDDASFYRLFLNNSLTIEFDYHPFNANFCKFNFHITTYFILELLLRPPWRNFLVLDLKKDTCPYLLIRFNFFKILATGLQSLKILNSSVIYVCNELCIVNLYIVFDHFEESFD